MKACAYDVVTARILAQLEAGARFGSGVYGREELVAEMAAAFLCHEAGIVPATVDNAAAYVSSWIRTIREDSRAVVVAAGAAVKAAAYILDRKAPGEESAENGAES